MKQCSLRKKWLGAIAVGLLFVVLMGAAAQAAGWKTTSKGKRYKDDSGSYVTDWQKIGGKWYYFGEKGYLQKGWLNYGESRYYLDSKTGARMSGKWFKVNGNFYYAASNGKLQKNKWIGKRYVKNNYQMAKGLQTIDSQTYYFGTSNGYRTVGWKTIGGYRYYFNSRGVMETDAWIKTGGKYYYVDIDGRKAVNTWIGEYWVDKNGARTQKTPSDGDENNTVTSPTKGDQIAAYGKKFVGNPYVYGGNSLTSGCDCSGFTQQVMNHFKIAIPRVADDQRKGKDGYGSYTKSVAVKPNLTELKAGDLVFYGNPSYHVALYIGDGKIVHAKNEACGIVIDKYNYNKPYAARRYWQ